MTGKGPGRYYRKGLSVPGFYRMFPNEEAAENWIAKQRWPNGVICPKCQSQNVHDKPGRKPQRYRCRTCRKFFSVKTDSLLHSSKISCQDWLYACYVLTTEIHGTSSMRLHRALTVTQKTAWFLAHRIRKMWEDDNAEKLYGAVEADEAYIGGSGRAMHRKNKWKAQFNKVVVVGAAKRATGKVRARVIPSASSSHVDAFLEDVLEAESTLYTDQSSIYQRHARRNADKMDHDVINHDRAEYVRGRFHTQTIESFWSGLKGGIRGTYRHISEKHADRYVAEFAGRHSDRPYDTIEQLERMTRNAFGKRLRYADLVADA